MEITGIDRKGSDKNSLLLVVTPSLNIEVFNVMEKNLGNHPLQIDIRMQYEGGKVRVFSITPPAGYIEWLTDRLNEAQSWLQHAADREAEKKRLEHDLKEQTLNEASRRTGLPIQ